MDNFFEEIIKKIKRKSLLRRIVILILALFVLSLVYNLLLLPTGLVAGGVNGIAVITNYVYGIDSSIMILLISLACLLFSFMYLGKERTAGSILATFLYPLFVKITALITQNINLNYKVNGLVLLIKELLI